MPSVSIARRPKEWDDPEAMAVALEKYFTGQQKAEKRPTISGMARCLGFCSPTTLWKYGKKDKFKDIISAGKLVVEEWCEEHIMDKGCAVGCIFTLCNMTRSRAIDEGRWINQKDVTTGGDKLPPAPLVVKHD